jgi:hypothetical protein
MYAMSSFIAQDKFLPIRDYQECGGSCLSTNMSTVKKKTDSTHHELVRSQNFVTAPLSLILQLNLKQSVTTVAVIFL